MAMNELKPGRPDPQSLVDSECANIRCPYRVGQHCWVRETWSPWADEATKHLLGATEPALYRADYQKDAPATEVGGDRWKSPRFMPKWASRITLEVTDVRVERVQDISEADAKAEGMNGTYQNLIGYPPKPQLCDAYGNSVVTQFASLWDEINGKAHPWSQNPWVWVIEFRRIKP